MASKEIKKTAEQETPMQEIPMTMEEMQAAFAKMLADAKEEAGKIVEAAKDEAKKIVDEAKQPQVDAEAETKAKAERKAWLNELVEVKLFKDNDKYKEPVFVSCNGETIAIERGVRVKVKRKYALILDNSEHQDYETSVMMESKSAEFAKSGL